MTEHQKEPWAIRKTVPYYIVDSDDFNIADVSNNGKTTQMDLANAERIVRCVNFCRAVSNEQLDNMKSLLNVSTTI